MSEIGRSREGAPAGSPAPTLDAVFRRSPRMVGRRIADQYVLVPIARNVAEVDSLYTLNRVGTFLWERFDGVTNGHAHVAAIVEGFETSRGQAAEDYRVFVEQLLEIGALEAAPK